MANDNNNVPHSLPIPIRDRRRSQSLSGSDSSSDSGSNSPASPLQTPITGTLPRVAPISPSTSPILSYFLSQSPKSSSNATFPFRRGMGGPGLFDDEEAVETDKPTARNGHARRASAAAWPGQDRFAQPPVVPPVSGQQQDRAAGLLRRLSLGGNMARPPIPVPKPVNATAQAQRSTTPPGMKSNAAGAAPTPTRKARRANTMAPGTPRPPRAPSPMGERILKGHFDGFN
ncbi:hypothetical protein L227DRAFT_611777 [Lentinus tigrinus ALCF2SS1-6]|uniref:Uncharacterized protein n=1 Tax=Lentinus tigrinus ALCF2SS1-6 TaxID=1328759 RepID=A0A5C2S8D8_9APHY|nr:hypothetical protein L227DRAFT_611777 [Lentinus tigrinus ALCF2SS1-6]